LTAVLTILPLPESICAAFVAVGLQTAKQNKQGSVPAIWTVLQLEGWRRTFKVFFGQIFVFFIAQDLCETFCSFNLKINVSFTLLALAFLFFYCFLVFLALFLNKKENLQKLILFLHLKLLYYF